MQSISPLHEKCSKCGFFYLEFENKDKICSFHGGNLCMPPHVDSDIVCHQCCMKQVGSKGMKCRAILFLISKGVQQESIFLFPVGRILSILVLSRLKTLQANLQEKPKSR
jgi:hypothetical protein